MHDPRNRCARGPIGLLVLAVCTACRPEITLDFKADAETYIRALCEDRVAKYEECDPDFEPSLEECIENFRSDFDDPCFAELDEFARCLVERLSCEEFLDVHIDTSPGSICRDFFVVVGECRSDHPRPSDD
jgi:hypothetical protein